MPKEQVDFSKQQEFFSLMKESARFDALEIAILRAIVSLENKFKDPTAEIQFTANQIAKEAGLSVTNAYKYLYSLQKKGMIESRDDKNKVFWISRSSNPFPRIFSSVTRDYLRIKDIFAKLEKTHKDFVKMSDSVWFGHKVYEQYTGDFEHRAAILLDVAKDEVLITSKQFYSDVILLDALKRAMERGIRIRMIVEEVRAELIEKLGKLGVDIRLGKAWPYVIITDSLHGVTDEGGKGIWFLNSQTHFKEKFENLWENADVI